MLVNFIRWLCWVCQGCLGKVRFSFLVSVVVIGRVCLLSVVSVFEVLLNCSISRCGCNLCRCWWCWVKVLSRLVSFMFRVIGVVCCNQVCLVSGVLVCCLVWFVRILVRCCRFCLSKVSVWCSCSIRLLFMVFWLVVLRCMQCLVLVLLVVIWWFSVLISGIVELLVVVIVLVSVSGLYSLVWQVVLIGVIVVVGIILVCVLVWVRVVLKLSMFCRWLWLENIVCIGVVMKQVLNNWLVGMLFIGFFFFGLLGFVVQVVDFVQVWQVYVDQQCQQVYG